MPKSSKFYQIIFIVSSIASIRMIIGATSALYLISRGLSAKDIVFLKSMQAFLILLLDIPLGRISDRFNRWIVLLTCVFFSFGWLIVTASAVKVIALYIAEALNAIALALNNGTEEALVVEAYGENIDKSGDYSSKALAIFNKYVFLGMGFAALLGSFFINFKSSLNWYIAAVAMFSMFVYITIYCCKNKTFTSLSAQKNEKKSRSISENIRNIKTTVRQFHPFIFLLFCISISINLIYQIVIQYWQLLVKIDVIHIPKQSILSLLFFLILIVQSHVFPINNYKKYKYAVLIVFLLLNYSLLTVSHVLNIVYLTPLLIIAFFWIFRSLDVYLNSQIHLAISNKYRATIFSIKSTSVRLFLILFSPIFSLLLKNSTSAGVSRINLLVLLVTALTTLIFFPLLKFKSKNSILFRFKKDLY